MTKKIWSFCLSGLIIITCSTAVDGIWCWEGNEETKTRINCNEEFQREEMYCVNKTERDTHKLRTSGCFALQWFEDKVGCHPEIDQDDVNIIQCVCATDLCNMPQQDDGMAISKGDSSACLSHLVTAYLLWARIFL